MSRASILIDPCVVELGGIAVLSILLFQEMALLRLRIRYQEAYAAIKKGCTDLVGATLRSFEAMDFRLSTYSLTEVSDPEVRLSDVNYFKGEVFKVGGRRTPLL